MSNPIPLPGDEFTHLVEQYQQQVQSLTAQSPRLVADDVLRCLLLRDRLAAFLAGQLPSSSAAVTSLTEADKQIIALTRPISRLSQLTAWRNSLKPPADAWWWYLSLPEQENFFSRYDWLWSALTVALLTVALGLLVDISGRFLSGGADTRGAFAIIIQSILTMLAAGGVLTKAGRQAVERTLQKLNIKPHYWQEIQVVLALGLVLGFLVFRLSLPRVAVSYYERGLESYVAGNLTSARASFERAIALFPDYDAAHFQLGRLHEELQDLASARAQYRIAMQGNYPAAFNQLARLHIRSGDNETAVLFLLNGLTFATEPNLLYEMHKNLGWARLGQERYPEARSHLQTAIELKPEQAPAYCLLAQVLEQDERLTEALPYWRTCLQYADGRQPDEDAWIHLARQRELVAEADAVAADVLPTPEAIIDDPGFGLLVEAQGTVQLKRSNWRDFQGVRFGTIVRRGDQIQPEEGSKALILCDDLSLWVVPEGVPSGLSNGCARPQRSQLSRPIEPFTVTLRPQTDVLVPYIVAPLNTYVLTDTPLLRWNPLPGRNPYRYEVAVVGQNGSRWLSSTTQSMVRYVGPPLQANVVYSLTVTADVGATAVAGAPFMRLPPETLAEVTAALERVATNVSLTPPARRLAEAQLYLSYGLRAEALTLLDQLTREADSVVQMAAHTQLGRLYLNLGLPLPAEIHYQQAFELLLATEEGSRDLETLAAIQAGLAESYMLQERYQDAWQQFGRASYSYGLLGDTVRQEQLRVQQDTVRAATGGSSP